MKSKFRTLVGAGAALAMVATLQLLPANVAHAYNPTLDGIAACQDDGSIKVTWTFVSDTVVSVIDVVSPAAIAGTDIPATTDGAPTSLSYTEVYPAGSTEASTSVTIQYDHAMYTVVTDATIALPGDDCAPRVGGEWCSPGYWRQPHHLDSWAATGISTGEFYNDYFGPVFADNPTLLQVLQSPQIYNRRGSGSFNNVGDLLSGAHPDVDFDGERVENCPLN